MVNEKASKVRKVKLRIIVNEIFISYIIVNEILIILENGLIFRNDKDYLKIVLG